MATIDYTIPGQFKGVQIESPENAMARAMQLRGMQEASQLNALKMQEYQQDVMEKNELAKIYANPNLKYGSPEFFSEVSRRAPRYFEKIATGEAQRQTALSTQQTREQQRREAEQKLKKEEEDYRSGVRNNRLIQIANAETPEEAYEMLQHYYGQGDLGYTDYRNLAPQLIENPNWEKTRTNLLVRTLSAEKQLTAPFDIRKAQAGASEEEQKLAATTLDFETKQLDARQKQFDRAYPPLLIKSADDVKARVIAADADPILGPVLRRFGTLEQNIAREVADFNQDKLGYIKRQINVPAVEILKAAEEKQEKDIRAAYDEHTLEASMTGKYAMPYSEFKADYLVKQGAAPAPAPEPAIAPAAAPRAESTTAVAPRMVEAQGFGRNVLRPEAASAIAPAAAPAPEKAAEAEPPSLPPVEVNYGIPGVSAAVVNLLKDTPEGRRKLAELIQTENSPANIAKRKLDSDRLQADITHRQAMEDIARRSENRQKDETEERKRHNRVLEGIQKNQYYLLADKPNQIANTQVDDNGTVTHFNARGQVIRSIPNAGKRSPALIKQEQAKAEALRTVESLIPDVEEMIKKGGLIDQSTGSGAGRLVDYVAEFGGYATEGSIASSRLEPIAAMITMTVPRFEGPQSEADRKFYERAAGDLANPRLPADKRKAAGEVVLRFMKQRKNQFALKGTEFDTGGAGAVEPPAGFVRDK